MRTTVDLPEDLLHLAKGIAHDTHQTMSETLVALIRRGLDQDRAGTITMGAHGLPVMRIGRPMTSEDVRGLEDGE
jgi:hypothetical protein